MKIAITAPNATPPAGDYKKFDVLHLEEIERASCTEINITDLLEYFDGMPYDFILNAIINRLRHEGLLILTGTDLTFLSKEIFVQNITVEDANKILYGEKIRCFSCQFWLNWLREKGMEIQKKTLMGYKYSITARRP